MNLMELEKNIRQWGEDRNITAGGGATVQAQASKGLEEMAEMFNTLSQLYMIQSEIDDWNEDFHLNCVYGTSSVEQEQEMEKLSHLYAKKEELEKGLKDDIGDVTVCMIQAARLAGTDLTECLTQSWGDIKDRKGTMINGKFHKN